MIIEIKFTILFFSMNKYNFQILGAVRGQSYNTFHKFI